MPGGFGRLVRRLVGRWRRGARSDSFVPSFDEHGRLVGLVDRATVEYLQSTAPDPSQSSLDAVLADTIRVRVVDNEVTGKRKMLKRARVLAEFSDITSIAKLRDCLQIIEEPGPSRHCMCVGDEAIELHTSAGRIETISLHHEYGLRWHAWSGDATLADNRRLLDFLADRGVPAPLERHEQGRARSR